MKKNLPLAIIIAVLALLLSIVLPLTLKTKPELGPDLSSNVTQTQREISSLNITLRSLSQDLTSVNNSLALLTRDLSDLKTIVNQPDPLADRLTSLQGQVDSDANMISTYTGKVNTYITWTDQMIAQLQTLLQASQGQNSELQAKYEQLVATVAQLSAQLNSGTYGAGTLLIGNTASPTGTYGGSYLVMTRFICNQSGTLSSLRLVCSSYAGAKAALYNDNLTLIAANARESLVGPGVNQIPINPCLLTAGIAYWIATVTNCNTAGYIVSNTNDTQYAPVTYSTFTFPYNFPGVFFTTSASDLCIGGYGLP